MLLNKVSRIEDKKLSRKNNTANNDLIKCSLD